MGNTIGSIENGVFIYKDTSSSLAEKKYIRFEKEDLPQYIDKFTDLVGEGILLEGCLFEDHKWIAYGNKSYKTFDFTIMEYNQQIYLPLKCFVILQLYDKRLV
ncbi:hypothetical protein, partial [Mesobacillus zeae]|uniref:hypothetical protein n=1 Tax=Mesobacillus zeae TaxID=1917180 RepID=UPI00300AA659